ncbi:MAG TPA: hypothetical protein VKA74_11700 [Myxococcota bacterium]|nr:hypothetical protein [Myxococcota bacterium]
MRPVRIVIAALSTVLLLGASAATAADETGEKGWTWEGSRAEEITAVGLDALLVRPLATFRVGVGALFLVPASILSAPGGRDAVTVAYEVFVRDPAEYAFARKLGQFEE